MAFVFILERCAQGSCKKKHTLQWRHNKRDGVSSHQPHDCLLNRLFKAQIKENIKAPHHWPLWGEFTGDGGFPHTKGQQVQVIDALHKIKSPAKFFMEWTKRFCGCIYLFSSSSYSGGITMTKKPTGYWRHYHSRCRPPSLPWSLASTPWATNTVYWCIASKLKVTLIFLWNEQHVFVCCFITISLTRYYNDKKPTGYWLYYHSRCRLPGCHGACHWAWRPHHDRWAYASNFGNIFLAFKWILMMRSGHSISHYTTAKLSVHVWNNDLIWQNKIDRQKHFHKNKIASS